MSVPIPSPVLDAMRERIERRGDKLVVWEREGLGVMLTRATDGRVVVSLADGPHIFDVINVLLDSDQREAVVAFLRDHGNEGDEDAG